MLNLETSTMREKLYWAAGLLDGEGCFYVDKKRSRILVCSNMTDPEPIEYLKKVLKIGNITPKRVREGCKPLYRWEVYHSEAIALMFTLYPLLCPRRQAKIRECVAHWKSWMRSSVCCKRGHKFTPETEIITTVRRGERILQYRLCRICFDANGRKQGLANKGRKYRVKVDTPLHTEAVSA